jgi:hypothetical protein
MSTAAQMYALSLGQIEDAIIAGGNKRTILVEGDMGTGKSSLLKTIMQRLPGHVGCYFDCTTKDLGDITIPDLVKGNPNDDAANGYVTYLTNEELGVHNHKPIALMIDEYGKGNPSVKNALLRLMLERKIGSYTLHPDSIVFATTNFGDEGVGDMLMPHQRNRISVISSRKPDNMEWVVWGINNGVDPILLSWAKDTPQLFQSFKEVKNPDDNPYIFHPRATRNAFVTPRSMEAASDWMKLRDQFDAHTLTALLIGTIGDRGAMDLSAYIKLADQMPTLEDIKTNPLTAKIPTSSAGVCMVVFRSLGAIERDWLDKWMVYMDRLSTEAQGMFANGVRAKNYPKQAIVMANRKFTDWAVANNFLFGAEKK